MGKQHVAGIPYGYIEEIAELKRKLKLLQTVIHKVRRLMAQMMANENFGG